MNKQTVRRITKEDVKQLRRDFDSYCSNAEQSQFIMLMMIDVKFKQTEKAIEEDETYIENHQSELRSMFRVILKVLGLVDKVMEYLEPKTNKGDL